jgi:hypothetical protein
MSERLEDMQQLQEFHEMKLKQFWRYPSSHAPAHPLAAGPRVITEHLDMKFVPVVHSSHLLFNAMKSANTYR